MDICKIKCKVCPHFEANKKLCLLVSNKDGTDKTNSRLIRDQYHPNDF